jgi:hypothetical protein
LIRRASGPPTSGPPTSGRRAAGPPSRKSFNWRGCLIESAIAIAVLNIIAALGWYFILKRLNH